MFNLKLYAVSGLGVMLSFLLLLPKTRGLLLTAFVKQEREVLASLDFNIKERRYKAIKLREGQSILVEIYLTDELQPQLIKRFIHTNTKDVLYDFKSTLGNLFAANLDDDEFDEIIVPTLDKNLVSRINIIKYDSQEDSFTQYSL